MPTVKLVDENCADPIVQRVFRDIKETKKIDFVPNIWRALATHPQHLDLCWTRLKAIMSPGKLDALTKEIIALAMRAPSSMNTQPWNFAGELSADGTAIAGVISSIQGGNQVAFRKQ